VYTCQRRLLKEEFILLQKPKAIFLDMDGTILNHQNQVSLKTKEIIDDLRKDGFFVFIATGRSFDEIASVVPEGFEVDGYVTSNGMAGYIGKEPVFQHTLPLELVKTIIDKAREHKVYYELFPYDDPRMVLNMLSMKLGTQNQTVLELTNGCLVKKLLAEKLLGRIQLKEKNFRSFIFLLVQESILINGNTY